ncbi:MAG: energy transducer TonB [Gemmatimonadetes bacterium]|nr:energy transducer TonB [Gemmatimonadota bacterium]
MFDNLIESKKKTEVKKGLGVGTVSLFLHTAIIAAVVYATLSAGQTDAGVVIDTAMVYLSQQEEQKPEEEQPQVVLDVPLKGFQTVIAPTEIPTDIPPVNLNEQFDPRDYSGTGVEGGLATGLVPTGNQVFIESLVEERPERLSGPPLVYPDLLRQAGIQGQVVVEAIIDTTGRVEANSVKIILSPHSGFDQSAKNMVLKSLYRPARVSGRAVRVLIRQPINFQITRR